MKQGTGKQSKWQLTWWKVKSEWEVTAKPHNKREVQSGRDNEEKLELAEHHYCLSQYILLSKDSLFFIIDAFQIEVCTGLSLLPCAYTFDNVFLSGTAKFV